MRHHERVSGLLRGDGLEANGDGSGDGGLRRGGLARACPSLRYFTRREIEKLFYRCAFQVRELTPLPSAELERWRHAGRPMKIDAGLLHVTTSSPEEAEELLAAAYRVQARDAAAQAARPAVMAPLEASAPHTIVPLPLAR